MKGIIERTNDDTLLVSELPIRRWTQDYKMFLEGLLVADAKGSTADIKDFRENHTDTTVSFTITAEKAKIDAWEAMPKGGLYSKFKLTGSLSSGNMHLFNTENQIVKYGSPESMLKEFYTLRLEFYEKRKVLLVQKLHREQSTLSNKARFVEEVCSGVLVVSNRKKVELLNDLHERGYDLFDNKTEKTNENDVDGEENDPSGSKLAKGYEYLLGMKIWSLTFEKAEELRAQLAERTAELEELEATSPNQIWLNDLDSIEEAMDERDIGIEEAEQDELKAQKKNQKRTANIKKKAAATKKRGKKKADTWESDLEDSSDEEVDLGSDSEVAVVKKTTARRKPAAAKKTAAKSTAPKSAAPKKAAPKKAAKAAAPVIVEEPEVDEVELSLAERMKKKMMISPPAAKSGGRGSMLVVDASLPKQPSFSDGDDTDNTGSSRGKKRPSPKASDSDDEVQIVDSLGSVASKATKPQSKRAKAPAAAKKKAAPKKAPKKKPEPVEDSDDEFGFDSDVEEVAAKPAARTTGRSRAATNTKKATYVFSSDEEGDSDSDF
jgi:DNA topoisomerase-2